MKKQTTNDNSAMNKVFTITIFLFLSSMAFTQIATTDTLELLNYKRQKTYTISDIKISGLEYLNPNHLVAISGLYRNQKIKVPGSELSDAISKYWRYGLFSDVQVVLHKLEGDLVDVEIILKEQPRMKSLTITGIKKGDKDDIEEKIDLRRGTQVTDNVINNTITIIRNHYIDKGFFNTEVKVIPRADTSGNNQVDLYIDINKNKRVKIDEIIFEGNEVFTDQRLRRTFKKTKQRSVNIFKSKKYIEEEYRNDKQKLLEFYNKHGYRDAQIVNEELVELNDKRIALKLTLLEGSQYYIRSIDWIGNTKYPSEYLNAILGIKEGQLYDKTHLDERLNVDEDAVSTLYMDNGYLFFNVSPVEVKVENDSIDLELRIYEGKQATINQVMITGNTKTNEHVVRRELYTRPGELFSKTDIIRSVREIATLGHFNPETISPTPIPDPVNGTVDLEYRLEERSNDQLELSGGWGGYYGLVGSIGLRFANFSASRFLDLSAWKPVPSGDGQTLSLRAQTNQNYHSFNISFMEPWFGGKKPNSFTLSANYTIMKNNKNYNYGNRYEINDDGDTTDIISYNGGSFRVLGGAVGFGKRLKFPDDYFSLYTELSFQQYRLDRYYANYGLDDGAYNLLSLKLLLSRSSQDQPIYPRRGSNISLGVQFTPPYSYFDQLDYGSMDYSEKFNKIEFHKWTFDAAWYTELVDKLVLAVRAQFGYLGFYTREIGPPPFEKLDVGGSGLSGYMMFGTDVIPMRGYEDGSLTPRNPQTNADDGNIYNRYYTELRYPVSLNPNATVYLLGFLEAGNCWSQWADFNPYSSKRSAGVGVRAFLPMFGLLGIDWGWGFDEFESYQNGYPGGRSDGISGPQWHFIIGQQF